MREGEGGNEDGFVLTQYYVDIFLKIIRRKFMVAVARQNAALLLREAPEETSNFSS